MSDQSCRFLLLMAVSALLMGFSGGPEIGGPKDSSSHWAFQPPGRSAIPAVSNSDWVCNPIDSFIAQEHALHGLTPQPQATKGALLRRVYLDLIGIPPTREQLHEFLADESPDAYEREVSRLLESP